MSYFDDADLARLKQAGYEFEITADGYFVRYKEQGLGGASVKLPRTKPLHWKHRQANIADNKAAAVDLALSHERKIKP